MTPQAAAVLAGWVGMLHERDRWRRAIHELHDLHEGELGRVEVERDQAIGQVHYLAGCVDYLMGQVAEALRIIADLADARVADADRPWRGQWVAPTPQAWATFQEGNEKAGEN